MDSQMEIRRYEIGEEEKLYQIFYSSIRQNAQSFYSDEQLSAWAPDEFDILKWADRIKSINPFVIVESGLILAYGDIQENGYIDHFFVRGGHSKQGVGKTLMKHLIKIGKERGISNLSSDVSLAAQGFFVRFGFEIIRRKEVEIRGVLLENALMRLDLKRLEYKQ